MHVGHEKMGVVLHRIDDLEKKYESMWMNNQVLHRIDDLETVTAKTKTVTKVLHRIDDLESTGEFT